MEDLCVQLSLSNLVRLELLQEWPDSQKDCIMAVLRAKRFDPGQCLSAPFKADPIFSVTLSAALDTVS